MYTITKTVKHVSTKNNCSDAYAYYNTKMKHKQEHIHHKVLQYCQLNVIKSTFKHT